MDYNPYIIHIILSSLIISTFAKRSALRWCGAIGWIAGLISNMDFINLLPYVILSLIFSAVLLVMRWIIGKKRYTSIRLIWNEGLKRVLLLLSIVIGLISAAYMPQTQPNDSFSLVLAGLLFVPLSIYVGIYCAGVIIVHLTRWIVAGFKSSTSSD